ncbi:hypothetical protein EV368DRAFT_89272 [Lentinula lateritia]|nr:hypothetical protein EV368DRAFT_89272 [Lentinula lateritia]
MTTSRTTTKTTTTVGSIPITGGTNNPPMTPPRPSTPSPSDEERELELQLEWTREKNRKLREQKKAEEEARKKVEEEAVRRTAVEERQQQEAAEKRRSEATTSARRVEVEVPCLVKKGKAPPRNEVNGGDPDDGDDSEDGNEDDEEKEPCEQCKAKKIPCLQQAGKRSSIISARGVGESDVAQLLADNRILREGQIRANTCDRHMMKKLEWLMRDAARRREGSPEEPIAGPSVLPKKRRRLVDSEEEREKEREQEEAGEEEEEDEPAPKKARSEKGKEREK